MVTRRCTQRQYLLRPDDATNEAFTYCLAEAAQRFKIEVLLPVAESNHHHTILFDRHGRICQFVEHFHKMVARCMNALRGRWENFWAAEEACITRLVDPNDVIAKLIYAASNPVKDGLVEKVWHWPGVNGYSSLLRRRALRAKRPRFFFDENGTMPEEVMLELTIPPELGARDDVLQAVRAGVEAVEGVKAEERRQTGARVVGRRGVLHQSWRDSPTKTEPRRNLRPRFAAANVTSRVNVLLEYRAFLDAYRDARERWLRGHRALFPNGTYWLRRFAAVTIAAVN